MPTLLLHIMPLLILGPHTWVPICYSFLFSIKNPQCRCKEGHTLKTYSFMLKQL